MWSFFFGHSPQFCTDRLGASFQSVAALRYNAASFGLPRRHFCCTGPKGMSAAWLSIAVAIFIFAGLWFRRWPSDVLFLGGLVVVVAGGAIKPEQALSGFANSAVITIGALFVVAAGLRSTGALDMLGRYILGPARDAPTALRRMAPAIAGLSGFMNNTPLVAMMVPVVIDWCRRHRVSPSKLLIPLSYLTILGGACTLVGTSTNVVVNGLLVREYAATQNPNPSLRPMHLFEIGYVGLPCAIVGLAYLLLWGHRLLPDRTELIEKLGEQRREYLVEMMVMPGCRLIGKNVEKAGLRHLPGLFLIEIDRAGEIIAPVTPDDVICEGDRLIFTGVVTTIVDLERIPGLVPAADRTYEVKPSTRQRRHLTEAVLSPTSPLIGKTVRGAKFRRMYNAAIVAVHRNGKRLTNKIGDIRLEAGDTLLLQTKTDFADSHRHSPDFSLVASLEGTQAPRHDRAWVAIALLGLLVASFSATTILQRGDWLPIVSIAVAGLMVATRCLPVSEARASLDIHVLITIGAALGLGLALQESGAAKFIAKTLVAGAASNPYLTMLAIYVLTMLMTEVITNNVVAAMMFPIAVALAATAGWDPRPFVMAITVAASSSFITPIGYQTNLMVMGPGGYEPRDYLRVGAPLALLMMVTALVLIPLIWPFK
jgi:di/tricarboxylate transporter